MCMRKHKLGKVFKAAVVMTAAFLLMSCIASQDKRLGFCELSFCQIEGADSKGRRNACYLDLSLHGRRIKSEIKTNGVPRNRGSPNGDMKKTKYPSWCRQFVLSNPYIGIPDNPTITRPTTKSPARPKYAAT